MSIVITADQQHRVKSFLKECNEHISCCLQMPVIVTYSCLPFKASEKQVREIICEIFDMEWHVITGKGRERKKVAARMCYAYLCRVYLQTTFKNIGISIGCRDHTSVIHLYSRIKDLIYAKDTLIMDHLKPAIERMESILNYKKQQHEVEV